MAKSGFEIRIDMETFDLDNLKNADKPLSILADRAVRQIRKQIRQRRSWDGRYYKGLSDKTIADKKRLKGTAKRYAEIPLRRTNTMYNAIQARKGRGNVYYVGVASVGSPERDVLAKIHQYKGVNKHTRIIRPFFGLSKKFNEECLGYLNSWVAKQLREAASKKRKIRIT